jgi:paraquat-inducible protein A
VGCHECDAVVEEPFVRDGGSAICGRCGGTLFRRQRQTVEITLALSISGAILFIVANAYSFLSFEFQGQVAQTTLRSGVSALWAQGQYAVAGLVALTTILAPAVQLSLLLFVLTPIYFKWPSRGGIQAFRWLERVRAWSMMEVFLIGILVAFVKLSEIAEIVPGLALWAFALLIPVLAGALAFLDSEMVWRELEPAE